MWEADLPSLEDDLRQGDLLSNVSFPQLDRRLEPDAQGRATLLVKSRTVIVVTQCCTVEQRGIIAVAPVGSTRELNPDDRLYQALMTEEPPPSQEVDSVPYAIDLFRLEPLHNHLPERPNRLRVAELTKILTFTGDSGWLRQARVARLTPRARQLLRLKLALFWSRVEETDAEALERMGFEAR